MSCPRLRKECNEFMCGDSVDGICVSNKEKQNQDILLADYNILIDSTEFQQKVLDYIYSDEFKNMVNSTVFKDNANYEHAIAHGMVMAAMLTSRCKLHLTKKEI